MPAEVPIPYRDATAIDLQPLAAELERAAQDSPDKPFIRMAAGEWSYGQVWRDCGRVAAGLQALGVGPGDRVSLLLPNGIDFVLAWFALARLGAVAAPVNTAFRGLVLRDAIDLVESRCVIVEAGLFPQFQRVCHGLPALERIVRVGMEEVFFEYPISGSGPLWRDLPPTPLPPRKFPPTTHWNDLLASELPAPPVAPRAFHDLALLLYTSGTTGRSKAAMLSNRFLLRQAQGVVQGLGLRADDVLYCPYPLFHLDAAVMTVVPALLLRAVAAIGERFSVSGFWDEVRRLRATVFDFMGATLTMLWKQPPAPQDLDHAVRLGWGVPLPAWAPEFEQRFGCRLVELYGSTEVGTILYTPLDAPRRPGACGKLVAGPWAVRLADAQGFEVPVGATGELLVRSTEPSVVTSGYWAMPEATQEAFRDQWFHTGDLLRQDADGWFYFVGRRKDMVRRRGENISAAEVEMAIEQHPDVLACAVVGVPSEWTEEEVLACVVPRPASSLAPQALRDWCSVRMARFQVPRYLRFMQELPRTPTDKIEKFRLQELGADGAWDAEAPAAQPHPPGNQEN